MALTKITLFEMAEAVGEIAQVQRGHVERWNRDHPDAPLPLEDQWVIRARVFETAHLTLSLMALDESASRKFVASLMGMPDAKMLLAMLVPVGPRAKVEEVAA